MTVNEVQLKVMDLQTVQLKLLLAQLKDDCHEKNELIITANDMISEVCRWFIDQLDAEIKKM